MEEELSSEKPAVSGVEESCTVMMNTKTSSDESFQVDAAVDALDDKTDLVFKNLENQGNSIVQKDIVKGLFIASSEKPATEAMTGVWNHDGVSDDATSIIATHSDKESALQNDSTQSLPVINNNNIYSDGDQASNTFDKSVSPNVQLKTDDRKLSGTDTLDVGILELFGGGLVEDTREVLPALNCGENNSEKKYAGTSNEVTEMLEFMAAKSGECVHHEVTEVGDKCVQSEVIEGGDRCVNLGDTKAGEKCVQSKVTERGEKCVQLKVTEKSVQHEVAEVGDKCVQSKVTEKSVQSEVTKAGDKCVQPGNTEGAEKNVQHEVKESGQKCVHPGDTECDRKGVHPGNADVSKKCVQHEATEGGEKGAQPDTTDHQRKSTELSANETLNQVTEENKTQSAHIPKYILVKRKSQNLQEASRKPGGKLTSLLQRLNAKINNGAPPECSLLNASNIFSKPSEMKAEAMVDQPTPSISSPLPHICGEATNANQVAPQPPMKQASSNTNQVAPQPQMKQASSNTNQAAPQPPMKQASSSLNQAAPQPPMKQASSTTNQAAPQPPRKHASSNTTDNSSVSFIQIQHDAVSKKAKLTFKSSPQTNTPTSKRQNRITATSTSKAHTYESSIFPDNIPIKIIKSSESLQSGSHSTNNEPTSVSLLQNKQSLATLKTTDAQIFTTVNEPKKFISSAEIASFRSLGQRTPISTDKGKYVLVALKDLPLAQSLGLKGLTPSTGITVESDSEPANVPTTTSKPKQQISLLKHVKLPVSLKNSTYDFSKVPTIYSLLANSPTPSVSSSKPLKPSTYGHSIVNIPSTTPNIITPLVMQELTKPFTDPAFGPNRLILAPQFNPGQIFFHSVPNTPVTGSNSSKSLARSVSKVTASANKKPKIKVTNAKKTSLLTSRPPAVIVVPTAAEATPLTTVLAPSTRAFSQSDIPVGIAAISNMSMKAMRTTPSLNATLALSPAAQHLADAHQSCSTLITKIAQRSLSHTSATKPSADFQTNLACPMDTAVTSQLAEEICKSVPGMPSSLRIIVSTDSGSTVAVNSGLVQAEDALKAKVTTSDDSSCKMYTTDVLTMSKLLQALKSSKASASHATTVPNKGNASLKAPQTSLIYKTSASPKTSLLSKTPHTSVAHPAVDSIIASRPIPSYPKPLKVTASHPGNIPSIELIPQTFQLVLPTMRNAVSLLNMSTTTTPVHNISALTKSSTSVASAIETHAKRKPKSKSGKAVKKTILEKSSLKVNSETSPVLAASFRTMPIETKTRPSGKQRENSVYSATLRTGQGPVSVMVVGPDIGDNSSDTLSDTGLSNLRCSVESQLNTECARRLSHTEKLPEPANPVIVETSSEIVRNAAACTDDNLPDKSFKKEKLDQKCRKELEAFSPHKRLPGCNEAGSDTTSDTEMSLSRYPKAAEAPNQDIQLRSLSLDDDDTDSDLDMGNAEEQDMSVLRQLLMNTSSAGLYDLTSKPVQTETDLKPDLRDDISNKQYSLELETAHKAHMVSYLEKHESKYSNKIGSIQKLLLEPKLQNSIPEPQADHGDFCGLKIESIFSLSTNAEPEEPELSTDNDPPEKDASFSSDESLVFNVRDSHTWKSFVNPCFVVLERLPEVHARGSSEIQSKKCSEHCRKRTLDYLCHLKLLKCVNHPEVAPFLKPTRRVAVKRSFRRISKQKMMPKRMCVNVAIVKPPPQHVPLLVDLKQELPCELDRKQIVNAALVSPSTHDTTEASAISETNPCQMKDGLLSKQDDKKTDSTMLFKPGATFSIPDSNGFLSGLEQLKKQVGKKRERMLKEKLTRKTEKEPLGKRKTKHISSKRRTLPLTENIHSSSKIKRFDSTNRTVAARRTAILNFSSTEPHADHLLSASSGLSHHIPGPKYEDSPKILSSFGKKTRMSKRRTLPVTATSTQNVPKVPIPKLRTGANVVNIQPKMQPLPAEKVKAALESLNSYLEATGRKPTEGNTQYILLKIDDQHILVKLPFSSASSALLNNVTLSSLKTIPATASMKFAQQKRGVSGPPHQQTKPGADSNIVKDVSTTAAVSTAAAVSMAPAVCMASAVSKTNIITPAPSVANVTSSRKIINTSNTDSSSIKLNTSVLVSSTARKENTSRPSLRITKTTSDADSYSSIEKTTKNSVKKPRPFAVSHKIVDQSFVSVEKPTVNASPSTICVAISGTSSSSTSSLRKRPSAISLLRPLVPSQSRPCVVTHVSRMNNLSSTTTLPVPFSFSSPSSSMETASVETSTSLPDLPPNSLLLPERKRKSSILTKEQKRRKLEAKYPLPPGVVIKSEPDDLDYDLSAQWTDASGASDNGSFPVIYTEHTFSRESSEMCAQAQSSQAPSSDKAESFLPLTTDPELRTQNSRRKLNAPGISTPDTESSTESCENFGGMLSTELCENIEDSLDEPPALVDETTSEDVEESFQTNSIIDIQEDMPPVLQPMFTSSCDLLEDTDIMEIDSPSLAKGKSTKTVNPLEAKQLPASRHSNRAVDSTSGTSLYSEASLDSGVDSSSPSHSSSFTSVKYFTSSASEKPICKNLKIQHLKELLKKKEMEIENMKKLRTEFPSLDLDHI